MRLSIELLQREKDAIDGCMTEWEIDHYPEARKRQLKKSKELGEDIEFLTQQHTNK